MGCGSSNGTVGISPQPRSIATGTTPNKQTEQVSDYQKQQKSESWSQYEMDALNAHNNYRARHGVAPLVLNKELCKMAQKYANHLAKKKAFEHSKDNDRKYKNEVCGENLATVATTASDLVYRGHEAVDAWYKEIHDYDYNNPGFALATGHFTQLIWDDTKELGQAFTTYKDGPWTHSVAVANYYPSGNFFGTFGQHVKPLI